MHSDEPLIKNRLQRLTSSHSILGQPDIICIRQTKVTSALFGRQKKIEDVQQNYISGLVFPTTAHFSSFISSRYKVKDPNKHQIVAKLYMFDAYGEKDIQIQISIPGSMEVKVYNLKAQTLAFSPVDYQRAYYSSILRSLWPVNFPGIVLYPLMNRIEILRPVLKNLVMFSQKHELRRMSYQLDICQRRWYETQQMTPNLSLEIVLSYCLDNNFTNLLKFVLQELRKIRSPKYSDIIFQMKLKQKKYGQVVFQTAQKLLMHSHANQLKQYQLKALFAIKRYHEVTQIGQSLIESGGSTNNILEMMLRSLIQLAQDQRFLKTLNLFYNMANHEETNWKEVVYLANNHSKCSLQNCVGKLKCISEYPDLCFPFDNSFLNRLHFYHHHKSLLQKNTKEGFTLVMLQRVEQSLASKHLFYNNLLFYAKQRGWNSLVKYRTQCFWLQSDFAEQEEEIKNITSSMASSDRHTFLQEDYQPMDTIQLEEVDIAISKRGKEKEPEQDEERGEREEEEEKKQEQEQEQEQDEENLEQQRPHLIKQDSFDGKLSVHDFQRDIKTLPKCTARPGNLKDPHVQKVKGKVQCNVTLQQTFFALFNDLKLQSSLQTWQEKLTTAECASFSKVKREVAALILLKKGFLNRRMLQNKRCQQALQKARSLSDSVSINLVACYQLVMLYVDNKNVGGVQFYLIQLIKILRSLGIEQFDIVPEWAKPILQFVVDNQGLSIIKYFLDKARNIHPVFKNVFGAYLRSNLTEEEVSQFLAAKK